MSDFQLLQTAFPNLEFKIFRDISLAHFRRLHHPTSYLLVGEKVVAVIIRNQEHLEEVEFPNIAGLQYLNVSKNQELTSFRFAEVLPNLFHLDLHNNQIKSLLIPKGFTNLKWLDIGQNQLTEIIFSDGLPNLSYLDLSENKISSLSLPKGLDKLQYLYARKNRLQAFTTKAKLHQLEILHLAENKLKELPRAAYTKLETLYVKGNPLTGQEERIIRGDESGNAVELISYLRLLYRDREAPNHHVKLIIVGNGRIGKTCMVQRLKGFPCPENQEYTHGISIETFTKAHFPTVKTEDLLLKVWDFGGQEIFYATHQFFFSEQAIYIYAWTSEDIAIANKAKDTKKAPHQKDDCWRAHEYWLDNIRIHGKDSPVLVVKTHCRETTSSFPYERLKTVFNLQNPCLDFDAASPDPHFVDNLKAKITQTINNLPFLGAPFPKAYYLLMQDIAENKEAGKTEISRSDFYALAQKQKIEERDWDNVLSYLVQTGEVSHFPDYPRLMDRIFIDPKYLTSRIYELIEDHDYLIHSEGIFDVEYAKQKFGRSDWASFLDLLKGFELIFEKAIDGVPHFIAPQYLKTINDSINLKQQFTSYKRLQDLLFILDFPRFLPENVMINLLSQYGPTSVGSVYKDAIYFIHEGSNCGCVIVHKAIEKNEAVLNAKAAHKIYIYVADSQNQALVAKEVFDKFMDLSKNATIHISVDKENNWVNCKNLIRDLNDGRGLKNIEDNWIDDLSGFDFLKEQHGKALHLNQTIKLDLKMMEEIKQLIAKNRIQEVFKRLQNIENTRLQNLLIPIQNRWNELQSDKIRGVLRSGEEDVKRNKIVYSLLELTNFDLTQEVDVVYNLDPTSNTPSNDKVKETLVYISYNWASKEIVDKIEIALKNKGVNIQRDINEIGYSQSIRAFMEDLGKANKVIVIISEQYFKSDNCMLELTEIYDNQNFANRIFPIVLKSANIYNPIGRIKYINYWDEKIEELDKALRTVRIGTDLTELQKELNQYGRNKRLFDKISSILKDLNALNPEIHQDENFESLYQALTNE